MKKENVRDHYKEIRTNGFRVWGKDHELSEEEFVDRNRLGKLVTMIRVSPPSRVEPSYKTHVFKNLNIGWSSTFKDKCNG